MKIIYEEQNHAQIPYPVEKQKEVWHEGRRYIQAGKSYEASLGYRLKCVIGLVISLALGIILFLIPFCFSSFRKSIRKVGKEIVHGEKIIHCIPRATRTEQLNSTIMLNKGLKNSLDELMAKCGPLQEAKCFVRLDFAQESLIKQFIIRAEGAPLDKANFSQKADRIKEVLDNDIREGLGDYKKSEWMILFRENRPNAKFALHAYNKHDSAVDIRRDDKRYHKEENHSSSATSITNMSASDLSTIFNKVTAMGFPRESQIKKNNEFAPGTFYHNLD